MKSILLILLCFFTAGITHAQDPLPEMINRKDSLSYFLGLNLGYELQSTSFESNPALILEGLTKAFKNQAPVDAATAREKFSALQIALREEEQKKAELEAQAAQAEGKAWMSRNAQKQGVVTTASGLQYEVLVKGEGPMPADTSTVTVHYEGKLLNGTTFDSSYDRGEPATFPLNRVIDGWTEGLQLMNVGSTYIFYIPSELGYGARGAGGKIPPHAVLMFKVQLLGIEGVE